MCENLSIIIPAATSILTSIIGSVVTVSLTRKELRNTRKERIMEIQEEVYLSCFKEVEPVINNPQLVFDTAYFESIASFKAEMKLFASSATLHAYREYLEYIYDIYHKYCNFLSENNPCKNPDNIEPIISEDGTVEDEINHVRENEITEFEISVEKYRTDHCPTVIRLKDEITKLLRSMRKDFDNNSIKSDVLE